MSKMETVKEQLADTSAFIGMYGGFLENYTIETVFEEAYAAAQGEPVDTAQLTYLTAHFGTFVGIDIWGPDREALAGLIRERIGGPWRMVDHGRPERKERRADGDWRRDYRSISVMVTTFRPVTPPITAPTPAGE